MFRKNLVALTLASLFTFSTAIAVSASAASVDVDTLATNVEPDVIKWRHHFLRKAAKISSEMEF